MKNKKITKPPRMGPAMFTDKPTVIDATLKQPDEWNVPEDGRPGIRMTSSQMPEIVNWKVGERYKIEIEVELTSLEKRNGHKGEYYVSRMLIDTYKLEDHESAS